MSNARINPMGDGIQTELLSPETTMQWDPLTGQGLIGFHARRFLRNQGDLVGAMTDQEYFEVSLSHLIPRTFGDGAVDPVTGADLSQVSGAGIMLLFKIAFDVLYNEANQPEDGEPD